MMPREPVSTTTKIAASSGPAAASAGPAPGLWLIWCGQSACDRLVPLFAAPLRLGRGRHEEPGWLSLDDERVSRQHATIRYAPPLDLFTIEDSGSTNGLFVNGARVRTVGLAWGDVVRVGDCLLVFAPLPAAGRNRPGPSASSSLQMVARSSSMLGVLDVVARVAPTDLTVLVSGETGCGKEVLAREIHRLSGRSGPFQAVNCGALPESLVESELFGHRKGAFTGAADDRPGLMRSADRGTLFLDEIGELPLSMQVKLLRVIEERRVRPVGDVRDIAIDVRLIAATNRKLDEEVEGRTFRADLYARLNEIALEIPPLNKRREEVPALLGHFLERHLAAPSVRPNPCLTADFVEALLLYRWPHNVRELEKLAKRIAVLWADREQLELELLPAVMQEPLLARSQGARPAAATAVAAEVVAGAAGGGEGGIPAKEELQALLAHHGGNVATLARHYGRDRGQIYRWIRKLGIDLDGYRDPPGAEDER